MNKFISRLIVGVMLVCTTAFNASAVDLGEIVLGKTYNIDNYAEITAKFTAPTTGRLIQNGVPDIRINGLESTFVGYGDYGQINAWNVVEGQTYTLGCDFVMTGGRVSWDMESNIETKIEYISPAEGDVLSTTSNYTGEVIIKFNLEVSAETATLSVGGTSVNISVPPTASNILTLNVKDALNTLYTNGTLNAEGGDAINIAVTGIKDAQNRLYNGNGNLNLSFVSAPKAIDMVSNSFAPTYTLKSYYPAGSADGIMTIDFSGALSSSAVVEAVISCGNMESEDTYYYEVIPAKVSGSTITIDFTGKLRELNKYTADFVDLKVSNVRDAKGNLAAGNGEGNVGSYSFNLSYQYIEPVVISSEFTPANGGSLKGVESIEIWFNNSDKVSFDGVKFSFGNQEVVVPKSNLKITVDGTDTTILVDVPEQVKGQEGVIVTLDGLTSLDGYDHSSQIRAMYDMFVVTLVSPLADGGSYATTGEEDFVFTVNTPYEYMRYDLYGKEWIYGSWFNEQSDGTYTSFNNNWPLVAGVDNYMVVRAWNSEADYYAGIEPVASFTFHFVGLTPAFSYSDVKFVSIDPEPNTVITPAEDFCFTITFDGLVNIGENSCINKGFGSSVPFEKIEPVDPEELSGASSVWKLYPGIGNLQDTGIDISIFAYDLNNKLVEGNMGGDEYDFLQFSYLVESDNSVRSLIVSPDDGASVEELFAFTISYPGMAVSRNYNYTGSMPTIMNKAREVVYTFSDIDIETFADITGYDEFDSPIYDENNIIYMYISPAITEAGSYVLNIPKGFFIVGSQFETYTSAEVSNIYTVGGASTFINVEPADGDVLESIEYIMLNTPAAINTECEEYITLYSTAMWGNVAEWSQWSPSSQLQVITEDSEIIGYKLVPECGTITADGNYQLCVPAGFFTLDGEPNGEIICVYTIGSGSGSQGGTVELSLDPAAGSTVKELKKINIDAPGIADAMVVSSDPVTIADAQGNIVASIDASVISMNSFDFNTWSFLGFYIDLGNNPITEPGQYVLTIPDRFFEFLDMSTSALTVAVYNVSPDGSVSWVVVDGADSYTVYSLSGVRIMHTDSATELARLPKGIYIINGKKTLVR